MKRLPRGEARWRMRLRSRGSNMRSLLLVGLLGLLVISGAAVLIGCQRDALLGPTGEATLQVEVALRAGAHRAAADTTASIDRIRVRAVELKSGAETTRASREITVQPEDETWSVVLKVAAGDRYRIEVEMDGVRSFGSDLATEHGMLYAGESELTDLLPDSDRRATVLLDDLVPRDIAIVGSAQNGYHLTWSSVGGAARYRVKESVPGSDPREISTSGQDFPIEFGRPPGLARAALNEQSYRVAAEFSRARVSAWSESVAVVVPVAPQAVDDLAARAAGLDSIVVSWTAPRDDDGPLEAYDLRSSFNPITVESFVAATPVLGVPVPGPSGREERVVLTGLLPETHYYFALITRDPDQHLSALSNVADATTGSLPPVCSVSASSIEFGSLESGGSSERELTIGNVGGGVLEGTVALACGDPSFSLLQGAGPFALRGGETVVARIRFAPQAAGLHQCSVTTGTDCGNVALQGSADLPPTCALSSTTLDFGALLSGEVATRTFEIRNAGGGTLSGVVPTGCGNPNFTVLEGAGAYALTASATRLVRVRYAPVAVGADQCAIDLGDCGVVQCAGSADEPPACFVAPRSLDFDPIDVGQAEVQSFRIRNLGGGQLRGTVTLDCPDGSFALSAGGGDYVLARDEERSVSVRYQPTNESVHRCTVSTGGDACAPVTVTGRTRHAPICALSTNEITFARLNVGEADEATFRITNEGEGSLLGVVSAAVDPNFRLIEGAGPFSLLAQQSRTVRVRFQPSAGGDFTYTIDAGTSCGTVSCTGSGEALPSCALSATNLDFGALEVGQSSERGLSILNVGGGLLVGEIAASCGDPAFEVVSGAGSYALAHGETREVTLRYSPSTEGNSSCLLSTGCDPVSLSGRATWPLSCELSADSLDFAPIGIGQFAEKSFSIKNTGPGPLTGSVSLACASGSFALTAGAGAYALAPAESLKVTVRFAPTRLEPAHCSVNTGVVCGEVQLFGQTMPAPACRVSLDRLTFPDTEIGAVRELGFTIENIGGGTLLGSVALDCGSGPFTLVAGNGDFALGAGELRSVTLRFAPTVQGRASCRVLTGSGCAPVEAEGIGYPPPACSLVPGDVDFGLVLTGASRVLSFDVKNVGGGTLTGTVPASCGDPNFTVVGGAGSYALTAGQAHLVQVRFAPSSAGVRDCTLTFAPSDGCGAASLHGEGILPPDCAVPVDSLDFGALLLNEAKDLSFEVKNQGQSPFSGNLTLSAPSGEFTLIAGAGPFSLGPNETHFVAVRYQPTNRGADQGSLDFGIASGCDGVVLRGKGETAAQCVLDTSALDFDLVAVGETRDLHFTVTNLGDRTLDGAITKDCVEPDFEIVGGDGPFSLGLNQERVVTVRFAPLTNGTHTCAIATALPDCPSVALTGFTQFCVTFPMTVQLLWGATPTDLDLHLWTPFSDGIRYHVYYGAPGESGDLPFATLDQDDQDGFGPEQITIHQTWPDNGEYAIAVDHFVGDGSLANSQALLRVTSGDGTVRDFVVPTNDDRPNLWWDFARLDRTTGCLTIVNSLRSDPPVETLTLPPKGAR